MADSGLIGKEALASYLERVCGGPVEVLALHSLADPAAAADPKGQLVEKAPGAPYWLDLDRMLAGPAHDLDYERARALGRFLAEAHAQKRDEPTFYQRRIRELVGHGECLTELRLHTHAPDFRSTVDDVLLLARRLQRAAAAAHVTPAGRNVS